ncbi:MAG: hybrid sensor histidine kinase/response regulator [bacterium]|nr:hybrid sensor histidine kinase/response regulator [bacterium]
MIQDDELRDLFRIESEEHLQKLDEGLLHLEKVPDDQARLDEVFREAHSMKGASRMLGVEGVEQLSHLLEDRLGQAKRGENQLDSETIDRIYVAVDAIRDLVHEAVTGNAASVDVVAVSDVLVGNTPLPASRSSQREAAPGPSSAESPASESAQTDAFVSEPASEAPAQLNESAPGTGAPAGVPDAPASPDQTPLSREEAAQPLVGDQSPPAAPPAPPANIGAAVPAPVPEPTEAAPVTVSGAAVPPTGRSEEYRIETIRINTEKLDSLLNQVGELTVAAQRVRRRPDDIEEIIGFWEDWNRASAARRRVLSDLETDRAQMSEQSRTAIDRIRDYLNDERERLERLSGFLDQLKQESSEDGTKLELIADRLEDDIRDARMLPLSTLFGLFPRTVRDLAREENKEVELIVEGGETRADKRIVEEMKDPLMHLLRNAVDHGVESPDERERAGKARSARLILRGRQQGRNVAVEIQDDGRGLDPERICAVALERGVITAEQAAQLTPEQAYQLIFLPGFSTKTMITDVSGRGVGMDVVRNNVELLKGAIEVESQSGAGTTFRLVLPTALTTTRVLLVQTAGQTFAIPTEFVEMTQMIDRSEIFSMEGRSTVKLGDDLISMARLARLLELPESADADAGVQEGVSRLAHSFVIRNGDRRLALLVDDLLDEQEIIFKPSGAILSGVRNVAGMTILESGSVCVVLSARDLLESETSAGMQSETRDVQESQDEESRVHTILLAEDSITTRMQEKRILERAGFEVVVAVDGQEAYQKLTANPGKIDAIVSDVEMPNMDGFTFAAKVRAHEEFRELPVVLVTTLSTEEHRRRGMEAGASAYITKSGFNQAILLDTLRRLL